jgi:polyphosphate kinase 2 (PPK2 family)
MPKPPKPQPMSRHAYHRELQKLQIELVKLQRHVIAEGERMLVIFEAATPPGRTAPSSTSSST